MGDRRVRAGQTDWCQVSTLLVIIRHRGVGHDGALTGVGTWEVPYIKRSVSGSRT